jgi:hypothetical protein
VGDRNDAAAIRLTLRPQGLLAPLDQPTSTPLGPGRRALVLPGFHAQGSPPGRAGYDYLGNRKTPRAGLSPAGSMLLWAALERRSNDSGAVAANRRLLGRSAHSSTSGRPLVERQLRGLLDLSGWEALVARIGAEIVAPPHEKESRGRRGSRGCIPRRAAASRPRPPWRRQRQCSSDGTRALLVLVHTGSVDEADRLDPGSCSAE